MDWTLLHKYLSGECSPGEFQKVEAWLQADAENQRFLDSLKKIWEVKPNDEIEVDAKSAWNSFQYKVDAKPERKNKHGYRFGKFHKKPMTRRSYSRMLAIWASAAAVILIAFLFARKMPAGNNTGQAVSQLAMQEVVTSKGQRTTFRLSDGTRVQLNADSRIEIPGAFMDSTRQVYLEGEAYFEVISNPEKPFIVHTKEAYTKVLGTKFGVKAYSEDDKVQVVVSEGKVALGSQTKADSTGGEEISINQIGILAQDDRVQISDVQDIQKFLGWKDGKLMFEDTPLREVRTSLERWFDITCTVDDSSLDNRRLTASFSDEPMTEVLSVIALAMDLGYEREGRDVKFRK